MLVSGDEAMAAPRLSQDRLLERAAASLFAMRRRLLPEFGTARKDGLNDP
jgi:hypothetical protein